MESVISSIHLLININNIFEAFKMDPHPENTIPLSSSLKPDDK